MGAGMSGIGLRGSEGLALTGVGGIALVGNALFRYLDLCYGGRGCPDQQ